ncbi:pilus assembly protein TadG-related protein [Nocardiopsis changdeensis]|uniref:Pilus assembly protein n=1 Tax=Nocardiopsis changdeensis TaxID=2831969 RepID=A0ABX8BQZ5_9ACTN|nr:MULTISPECIES: pilus assembly protein TadG-related protein [Nocardiopsis]QUX24160.1 pilus assembly protein [Nocardiopsis changdeensis]QYX34555.1 pilus assembly protein [Nocardiopsis sp. MT53]
MSRVTRVPGRNLRWSGDRGNASVFLIMLMPVVMAVFALVWEAGQMLLAKTELLTAAHEAARAGAQQIDQNETLRTGTPVLAPHDARRAAIDHLRSPDTTVRVEVGEDRVTVLAHTTYTPVLLPIGVREIEAEATATALPPR